MEYALFFCMQESAGSIIIGDGLAAGDLLRGNDALGGHYRRGGVGCYTQSVNQGCPDNELGVNDRQASELVMHYQEQPIPRWITYGFVASLLLILAALASLFLS